MKPLVTLAVIAAALTAQAASEFTAETPAAIKHWQDARFGMFIHWGPVSLTGQEIGWSRGNEVSVEEYDKLYKRFNPIEFNAEEWVSIAKASGMNFARSIQPDIVINDRTGAKGDYDTPEQKIGGLQIDRPWKPSSHMVSTRKGDKIYLHLLQKVEGPVSMTALPIDVRSAKILNGQAIQFSQRDELLSFEIPASSWDKIDTIIELTIGGDSMAIEPIQAAALPNVPGASASASVILDNDLHSRCRRRTDDFRSLAHSKSLITCISPPDSCYAHQL